ncbi:MAG: tRNA preQ1(34) S-adenosylmethionine ribosyltransferase-isomerase QueA [Planctomycetaceae bacterium]|nr:tRNA preQ1(34) S-adenosylmethionine ribosyltransferase-isomerase QueA [Planctomycetaceae bacterium]|tara:strand:+ start:2597 stop:3643 length:1047 start_codon:yes stop_codon:yes gene_type:complete
MALLEDYDYALPPELIAQRPTQKRGDSRLLLIDRSTGKLKDMRIADLPDILEPSDAIVLNNTQVIPARLRGTRLSTGGRWEGLFISADQDGDWKILSKTRGKIQIGEQVVLSGNLSSDRCLLEFIDKRDGGIWIVRPMDTVGYLELLNRFGEVPLPPYIRKGVMSTEDINDYQTVYAEKPGAVAAPTAGLHFDDALLSSVNRRGVDIAKVTLHVGIGTFRPIVHDDIDKHAMHCEWGEIDRNTANRLSAVKTNGGRIISVGTTSVRVLETCATSGTISEWQGTTDLFIKPGYRFKAIDGLLTNFHLPKSTLLVLVRTFGGDALMKEAYAKAIEWKYRFYSYGDAMLIL